MCFKKRRRFRRPGKAVLAVLAAALMLAAAPSAPVVMQAGAESVSDLEAQSKKLDEKAKQLQAEIDRQKKNQNDKEAYKASLDKMIDTVQSKLTVLASQVDGINAEITSLNANISEKEASIAEREGAIEERSEMLRQRLRAIAKTGNSSTFQMLMETEDYTDYLIKSKMAEKVAASDQALMDELEQEIESIDAEKTELEQDKAAVDARLKEAQALKDNANAENNKLTALYAETQSVLKQIQGKIATYQKEKEVTEAEQRQLDAKIAELTSKSTYDGKYTGPMYWPVPAVRNVSSGFGMRWGKLHKGIDISEGAVPVYGQSIVAAAPGQVLLAYTADSYGGGYGYHIMIYHGTDSKGRKIVTLYAHCSQLLVKTGQIVGAKQVIAKAGATGNVTGPHLHFEVRINNTPVDPISNGYVTPSR